MLGVVRNGIVRVAEGGEVHILRPGKNGGRLMPIAVSQAIADRFRLATGDVVEGDTEQGGTERLIAIRRINGLLLEEAEERPFAKTRRSHTERTRPDQSYALSMAAGDSTGRILDFAAPLGRGDLGAIYGPHGSGLTRTLRSVLQGVITHAPDAVVLVLAIQTRGEEITDWRRRFPDVDIVVCPTASGEMPAEEALLLPTLVLETAQRQTELGKDVVLLIDSLTALWGLLLETEEATAQREADQSQARQRILEFVRKAGCFHGETPLGGCLGGTLTVIGTVWHQEIDVEAEEDRELHPHLRLLEQVIPDLSWRVPLHPGLALQRLYPAIDVRACLSQNEASFLSGDLLDALLQARSKLPRNDPLTVYHILMDAMDQTTDMQDLIARIVTST